MATDPPLRVLHLTPRLGRAAGGAWHYVEGLAQALRRGGVQCAIAGVADPANDPVIAGDVPVLAGRPTWLPANFGLSRELASRLDREVEPFDVVHAHGFRVGTDLLAMRCARRWNAQLIWSPHGLLGQTIVERSAWRKRAVDMLWGRRLLARVDGAIAVSDAERTLMCRVLRAGLPTLASSIGIDVDSYGRAAGAMARLAPASVGRRVVLYLAIMHANKGLNRLADAWLRVRRDSPGWHLVIAGSDVAGIGAAITRQLNASGAGGSFTMLGPVYGEDQRSLLAEASLFAMPSDSESFGIAFAESLASGVPIIAPRESPWAIAVDHGCGWCVAPTVDAVATALREALTMNENDLRTMGDRGRQLARERFDWSPIAAQVRAFYESILTRPRATA